MQRCQPSLILLGLQLLLVTSANAQLLLNALASDRSSSSTTSMFPFGQSTTVARAPGSHYCRMEKGAEHPFCGLPYELSNFQGHFKCDKSVMVGRPADWNQAANLVEAYDKVKAVGVGHSWWREQFCSGNNSSAINIVTTEFTSVLPAMQGNIGSAITADESAMTVKAAAGVTQRTLLNYLDNYRTSSSPDGYTLPAFSWFIDQTIGGAVSTATHGSSLVYGSLSSQLRALTIMDAAGNIRTLTPSSDPHLWKAATVSVGRLGIILEVTLSIVRNSAVRREKKEIAVEGFVDEVVQLQAGFRSAAVNNSMTSRAVWDAVKSWNEVQLFWFVPSRMLWRVSFTRLAPVDDEAAWQVMATDGPGLPEGAHTQQEVQPVGTGIGIEVNPVYWSDMYRLYLAINVEPDTLPARQSYVSISEFENRMYAGWNSYDQYEVAIPLSKVGDCMTAVNAEMYGPNARWRGFRAPALIRFIKAERSYLSPAHGEPVMYINLEDHVSYATKSPNTDFQAIMDIFRSPVCGPARLHWGKAGWPQHAKCFDGSKEYPSSWCDFGCAVQRMDPQGKFAGEGGREVVWQWNAVDKGTGAAVADYGSCCSSAGFDYSRCQCAARRDCSH